MIKILVVDDEQEILALLNVFLRKKGFEVIVVDKGEEALEILNKDESVDLIILDQRMPRLSGAAVLAEVRKMKRRIPVILLTGSLGRDTRKLEADAFFTKPVDLERLFITINDILGSEAV